MTDYRLPQNRREYFDALYRMNLEHGVMPGLVYLYMPKLAEHYGWDAEQRLWFAFLNGCTQNPITSLRMFQQLPECPSRREGLGGFVDWFNANWATLQFDTDRRHQKRDTLNAITSYSWLVEDAGSQRTLYTGKTYDEAWAVANRIYGFGRLSTFSYLEYVYLNGYGPDCDNLMFNDKSGSKSHRNGALFLHGLDHLVSDKRQPNGHSGKYDDFDKMCAWLEVGSAAHINHFRARYPELEFAGRFTYESACCQFKNGFFRRRYPGVYADMAQERIEWYDAAGFSALTKIFKDIRAAHLPEWLKIECARKPMPRAERAALFADTGIPYRAENFL